MPDDDVPPDDNERRTFLARMTVGAGAVGAAAACWPLIRSMDPSSDVMERATTEVELSRIAPGEMLTVPWQGKPVFIVHRTGEQISAMEASQGGLDPELDNKRVKRPEWLVVVGVCTHLGCVPNKNANGWLCPCHGSMYDNSGRVVKGPAPRNLDVPPYRFLAADRILIGEA